MKDNTIIQLKNTILALQTKYLLYNTLYIVWSVQLMYNVKYWLTYFIFNLLFVAETTVDNISDKQINSLCRPAVEGENAPQTSPIVKKAKKSLRKQTNTSPVLDIGKTQYLFFKQAIRSKS